MKLFPRAYVKISNKTTKEQMKVIVPAGSLLNSIYAILLMILGKKKNNYGLFLAGFVILEAEMTYWNLLIPTRHSDAENFYQLFPNIRTYNFQLSIILSIVQILFFGFSIKSVYDIFNNKDTLYLSVIEQEKKLENIIQKTIKKYQLY